MWGYSTRDVHQERLLKMMSARRLIVYLEALRKGDMYDMTLCAKALSGCLSGCHVRVNIRSFLLH